MENLNAETVKKALEEMNVLGLSPTAIKKAIALINSQEQRIKEHDEERTDHISMLLAKDVIISDLNDKHNRFTKENKRLERERDSAIVAAKMAGAPFPEGLEIVHGFCQKEIRKEKETVLNNVRQALMERVRGIYLDENELFAILDGIINLLLKEEKP